MGRWKHEQNKSPIFPICVQAIPARLSELSSPLVPGCGTQGYVFTSSHRRGYSLHVVRVGGVSGMSTEGRRKSSDTHLHVLLCRKQRSLHGGEGNTEQIAAHSLASEVATWTHSWTWGTKDLSMKFQGGFFWGTTLQLLVEMLWGLGELNPTVLVSPGTLEVAVLEASKAAVLGQTFGSAWWA